MKTIKITTKTYNFNLLHYAASSVQLSPARGLILIESGKCYATDGLQTIVLNTTNIEDGTYEVKTVTKTKIVLTTTDRSFPYQLICETILSSGRHYNTALLTNFLNVITQTDIWINSDGLLHISGKDATGAEIKYYLKPY